MDAKARLQEAMRAYCPGMLDNLVDAISNRVLAEFDLTPKAPPGPVTSEATIGAALDLFEALVKIGSAEKAMGETLDAIRDRYARDHGLLTPAEVERALSSFDWSYDNHPNPDEIMAALTREAK